MFKLKMLMKKYETLFRYTLEKNKQILIDSFALYFGENTRSLIEKRFQEISFVCYINWEDIEYIVKYYRESLNLEQLKDILSFYDCYKKYRKSRKPIDSLVVATDPRDFKYDTIINMILQIMENCDLENIIYMDNEGSHRVVVIPLFFIKEKNVIHEIGHALTREIEAIINDEHITKTGVSVDRGSEVSEETIVEELLNERASDDITEIFKRRGGDLTAFCFNLPFPNIYEYNLYLIEAFYQAFLEYLKIARITDNKNELVKRVGKINYDGFVDFVNRYYEDDEECILEDKTNILLELDEIIKEMKKCVLQSHEYTEEEYLNLILQSGYKLRKIKNPLQ